MRSSLNLRDVRRAALLLAFSLGLVVAPIGAVSVGAQPAPARGPSAKPFVGGPSGLTTQDMTQGVTAQQMAQSLVGGGVTISNVQYTGAPIAGGNFTGGANPPAGKQGIGFNSGIILSSGKISNVIGPNTSTGISQVNNTPGDGQLTALANQSTCDASVLQFDFVPTQSTVSFSYVFASDEYPEFVGSFNDVFAFYLNGQNIALIPGTTTPVSINNVNDHTNQQFYRNNNVQTSSNPIDTEMDGLTTVLTAQGNVTAGATSHIKLAIADAGDCNLDSNVLIQAGSFVSGPTPGPTSTTPGPTPTGPAPIPDFPTPLSGVLASLGAAGAYGWLRLRATRRGGRR